MRASMILKSVPFCDFCDFATWTCLLSDMADTAGLQPVSDKCKRMSGLVHGDHVASAKDLEELE
jgi:hypothetical protein